MGKMISPLISWEDILISWEDINGMVNMEERAHLDKCDQEIGEYLDDVVEALATK